MAGLISDRLSIRGTHGLIFFLNHYIGVAILPPSDLQRDFDPSVIFSTRRQDKGSVTTSTLLPLTCVAVCAYPHKSSVPIPCIIAIPCVALLRSEGNYAWEQLKG